MNFATTKSALGKSTVGTRARSAVGNPSLLAMLLIWGYTAAILVAEWVGAYHDPLLALILHSLILVGLLTHAVIVRAESARRLLLVLSLLPVLRIASLVAITSLVPTVYLYVLVALPLTVAGGLIARLHGLTWATLGLHRAAWQPQMLVALSGLPLSLAGYWFLQPEPLITRWSWPAFLIAAFILVIFAAAVEELLFRGLLQQTATTIFGAYALLYASVVYAISYGGWQSFEYFGAALLLGLYFGWWARHSGSLWGVIAAHGLINIGMLLVWPFVF